MSTKSRPLAILLTLAILFVIIPAEIGFAAQTAAEAPETVVVISADGSPVFLYQEPAATSPLLSEVTSGYPVLLIARDLFFDTDSVAWSQISIDGVIGFVPPSTNLQMTIAAPPPAAESTAVPATIVSKAVFGWMVSPIPCFDQPSLQAALIIAIAPGSNVDLTGEIVGEWQPVLCNGLPGFIMAAAFVAPRSN